MGVGSASSHCVIRLRLPLAAIEMRLVADARGMAAAVFCDAPGGTPAPLRALEQSTIEARRSEARACAPACLARSIGRVAAELGDKPGPATSAPGASAQPSGHGVCLLCAGAWTRLPHTSQLRPAHAHAQQRTSFFAPGCTQGLRLYWRSLEALVAAEHARAGPASQGAAASLLAAPLFHRCVAGCAFEVVIGAYRMVRLHGTVLERNFGATRVAATWCHENNRRQAASGSSGRRCHGAG